ncbi:MAG: hypothetical protein AB7L41_04515 [Flavobacteriaceae bacterium]
MSAHQPRPAGPLADFEGEFSVRLPLDPMSRFVLRVAPREIAARIRRVCPCGARLSVAALGDRERLTCLVTCRHRPRDRHPSPAAIRAAFSKARKEGSPTMKKPNTNGAPTDDGGRSPTGDQRGKQ